MFPKSLLAHLTAKPAAQITLPVRGGSMSMACDVLKIAPPAVEVRLAPEGALPELDSFASMPNFTCAAGRSKGKEGRGTKPS
jgi:hypothetical protein